MFGRNKKGKDGTTAETPQAAAKPATSGKPSKDDLIAQAMANAKIARVAIGEETLNKVAAMLEEQNRKLQFAKARDALLQMAPEHLADHIKDMIRDKKGDH